MTHSGKSATPYMFIRLLVSLLSVVELQIRQIDRTLGVARSSLILFSCKMGRDWQDDELDQAQGRLVRLLLLVLLLRDSMSCTSAVGSGEKSNLILLGPSCSWESMLVAAPNSLSINSRMATSDSVRSLLLIEAFSLSSSVTSSIHISRKQILSGRCWQ